MSEHDANAEDDFEDIARVLKQGYAGSDIDVDFSRELLVKLEAELDETASGKRTTRRSAVRWNRWSVVAAGLAACATIGLIYYFGALHQPPPRQDSPPGTQTVRTATNVLQPQHVDLQGAVVDENEQPVKNVSVIDRQRAVVDENEQPVENVSVVDLGSGRVPGPEAWVYNGAALLELGQFEDALKCYGRAIKLRPDLARAWVGRGAALVALGRFQEALECYDRAIELKPDDAEAWSNKGATLAKLEREEEAKSALEQATRLGSPQAGQLLERLENQ